jgi:2',3'-cyclic-nucleotide 2'-phosphodiesterase (5'-nucleotidase family)
VITAPIEIADSKPNLKKDSCVNLYFPFHYSIGIQHSAVTFRPSTDTLPYSSSIMKISTFLALVAGALTLKGVTAQQEANLSIVHINDHHSNLDELNLDLPRSILPQAVLDGISPNVTTVRTKYGSFPRVVSLIKQLSNQAAAAGWNVLRVHAGDAITGTNYFSFFGYLPDAAVLNLAGFEAMTIGNHEFDRVSPNALRLIHELSEPLTD